MTEDKLKEAKILLDIIEKTKDAIINISRYLGSGKPSRNKDNEYDDGFYSLSISECSDGSGNKADLHRYAGNKKLLEVVLDELKNQVTDF